MASVGFGPFCGIEEYMKYINSERALRLAQTYIEQLNETQPGHPDYICGFDGPFEYEEYWYFNHCIIPKPYLPKEKTESFAGAPGFIISKDTEQVRTIGWLEYHGLQDREVKLIRINQIVEELACKQPSLKELRQLLDLTPLELLDFRKRLERVELDSEQKKQLLKSELKKKIKEE